MISKPKSQSLSLIYFPFTIIAPSLVEALSPYFGRVIVYRPVGSPAMEGSQRWITRGFLEIRVPFQEVIDKKALMAELEQWRTWGLLNQGVDTAYLKATGGQMAPVHPMVPEIASEIRGTAGKTSQESKGGNLACQLFLHLAQDFDRQSRELGEQLKGFKVQQQALQALFRVDRPEEGEEPISSEPFPESNEDLGGLMIENRLLAWNHLFQEDPHESGPRLTDSPEAHARFLDLAQENIPLLQFDLPCTPPPPNNLPWTDPLGKLFHSVLTTPWNAPLRQRIDGTARDIEAMMESWRKSVTRPGEKTMSFHWHVLPNQPSCGVPKQRRGLDGGEALRSTRNTLVGLVEHGLR